MSYSKNKLIRFLEKVEVTDGCWWWKGSKDKDGYGKIQINNRYWKAHRLSFDLFKGPIDPDLLVLHSCDEPGCVNHDHLRQRTHSDNTRDMVDRCRHINNRTRPDSFYQDIRDRFAAGESQTAIAEDLGVRQGYISKIVRSGQSTSYKPSRRNRPKAAQRQVAEDYATGEYTYQMLADKYQMSVSNVGVILMKHRKGEL